MLFADDEDFDLLNRHVWHLDRNISGTCYAWTKIGDTTIYAHQMVMPSNNPDITPDHKDHNGLNCCKSNLRLATKVQQSQNRRKAIPRTTNYGTASKYKGVSHNKKTGGWYVRIVVNSKTVNIGTFPTENKAAIEYNRAAKKYFGEFAQLNEIKVA